MDEATLPGALAGFDDPDEPLRAAIKAEMAPDERLLWAARGDPQLGRELGCLAATAVMIVVLCAACSISLKIYFGPEADANTRYGGLLYIALLTGLGAVLLVLGIGAACFEDVDRRRKASRTFYALTDRRAIIWYPAEQRGAMQVISYRPTSVAEITRVERPDGSGDVRFVGREQGPHLPHPSGFLGIRDVRQVEVLARRTLVDSSAPIG